MDYTILKFGATWCQPCKEMTLDLNKNPLTLPDGVTMESYDVDENERLVDAFNITSVPTIIILKDKQIEVSRQVGLMTSQQLQNLINEICK